MTTISNEQRARNFMQYSFKTNDLGGLTLEEFEWAQKDSDVVGDERFRELYILKILEALKLHDIDDASFVDNIPQVKEPRFSGFDSFSILDKEVCEDLDQLSTYTLGILTAMIKAKAEAS